MERDPTYNLPDADRAPEDENASGPLGEIRADDDTSGGPLSGGAGEGRGQGDPDVDVPGGSDEGVSGDQAIGGGGKPFEG